jgi:hypothetical protein
VLGLVYPSLTRGSLSVFTTHNEPLIITASPLRRRAPESRRDTAGGVGLTVPVAPCYDTLYFVSGPQTRKARNLAADGRCSFAISLPDLDLVLDGTTARVTEPDTLARVARGYDDRGWPLQVDGGL